MSDVRNSPAETKFPFGSIKINLGIELIPKVLINSEFQSVSAKS